MVHEDLWDNGEAALGAEMLPGPSVSLQMGMWNLLLTVVTHNEGCSHPHLEALGVLLPPIGHNTKSEVAPTGAGHRRFESSGAGEGVPAPAGHTHQVRDDSGSWLTHRVPTAQAGEK